MRACVDREKAWHLLSLMGLTVVIWMLVAAYDDVVITRVVVAGLINLVLVLALFTFSGNSGVMSFGHIVFAALGAYTTAYLTIPLATKQALFPDMPGFLSWLLDIHSSTPVSLLLGGAVAALFALFVSPAMLRLPALQGSIATLSLLIVIYTILNNWTEVTRGQSTMLGVPANLTLNGAAVGALGAMTLAWVVTISNVGLRLRASREDPIASQAIGVSMVRDRTVAWVVSGFIAGVGGAMYAHFITTFNPDQFYLPATFVIVAMLVTGGRTALAGAVIGTVVFTALSEIFRRLQAGELTGVSLPSGTANVLLALFLLLIIILRPSGITGGREIPLPRQWGRARIRKDPVAASDREGESMVLSERSPQEASGASPS